MTPGIMTGAAAVTFLKMMLAAVLTQLNLGGVGSSQEWSPIQSRWLCWPRDDPAPKSYCHVTSSEDPRTIPVWPSQECPV